MGFRSLFLYGCLQLHQLCPNKCNFRNCHLISKSSNSLFTACRTYRKFFGWMFTCFHDIAGSMQLIYFWLKYSEQFKTRCVQWNRTGPMLMVKAYRSGRTNHIYTHTYILRICSINSGFSFPYKYYIKLEVWYYFHVCVLSTVYCTW